MSSRIVSSRNWSSLRKIVVDPQGLLEVPQGLICPASISTQTLTVNWLVSGQKWSQTRPVVGTLVDSRNISRSQCPFRKSHHQHRPKEDKCKEHGLALGGFPKKQRPCCGALEAFINFKDYYFIVGLRTSYFPPTSASAATRIHPFRHTRP